MKFASPGWLFALLLPPIIYGVLIWDEKTRQIRFETFARRGLWPTIAPELDPRARLRKVTLWVLMAFFAILAMARPQWGFHEETTQSSGLDVMVVLDVSNSMEAEDVVPSRLKKAKHFLRAVAEKLQGNRVGLVSFAGGAAVASPLTTDVEYFLEVLQIQSPKLIPTQGTDIGLGLETAARALDRGAEDVAKTDAQDKPSRAIVLVTDGEDHEGQAREAAAELKKQGIRLYVFGVGTEKGAPVPLRDDSGSLSGYKRDRAGQPVVTTFHPDDLIQIASSGGGRYWNVTMEEGEADEMLKDMGALSRGEFAEHRYLVYQERFQYPLTLAVIFLLLEMSLAARRIERKKWVVILLSLGQLGLVEMALSHAALASEVDTYLENKKGVDAYKKGNVEEAQKHFGSAQALDPSLPELQYNQGLVQMQRGDTDAAIHDFQESARGAINQGNQSLVGQSFFNLGSALSKKEDLKGAVQSYLAAIHSAQQAGNTQLESDARKNLELLAQEQQKQKQQKQKQDQDQKKQQQDQKDQSGQKDQKNEKDQKDQKGQQKDGGKDQDPKKDQKQDQQKQQGKGDEQDKKQPPEKPRYDQSTSRGKKFESKKLTAEDAERVMAELKNRERDLQVRMKKRDGNRNETSKDW